MTVCSHRLLDLDGGLKSQKYTYPGLARENTCVTNIAQVEKLII